MISQAIVLVRRHPDGIGPATRVAGLSVVGRLLHVLADAGVRHVWVLGTLAADEIDSILDHGIELRIGVELAHPRERETETAAVARISASAGAGVLLVHGDVVTSTRTIAPLLAGSMPDDAILGMAGGEWTGIALLPRGLYARFQALPLCEVALEQLQREGRATTRDVPGPVRRLLGGGAVRLASRELYDAARQGPGTDGPIARHVLRPMVAPVVATLLRLRVAPTVVTVAWLAAGLCAAFVLAMSGPDGAALGVTLMVVGGLLDYVDGALARLQHRAVQGAWLDRIGTDLVQCAMLSALTARAWGETGSLATIGAGLAALWMLLVVAGARYARVLALAAPRPSAPSDRGLPAVVARIVGRLRWLGGRDVLLVLALAAVLLGMSWIVVWYALVVTAAGLAAVGAYAFGPAATKA